tara:strand:- start:151 stop:420 length:270 start_codon:yes stop_codon:yes gene_type:complete
MNYIIEKLNGSLEIENPIIEIVDLENGKLLNVNLDFINNIVGLEIKLITPQAKFGLMLENVKVEEMVFGDGSLLQSQVQTALDEQYGVI